MRFRGLFLLIILNSIIFLGIDVSAQNSVLVYKVKYESAEHIYIDGGIGDGVSVGDTLGIYEGDSLVAEIEVVFASEHSASCKLISGRKNGFTGLTVVSLIHHPEPVEVAENGEKRIRPGFAASPDESRDEESGRIAPRVKGRAAVQLYTINDKNPANLDLIQPTLRFDLEIRDLYSERLSLKIKTRTRYTDRTKSYNSRVPDSEWRNKVYQASINYDGPENVYGFRLGRIIPGSFSGVGYIDGLMAYRRLSEPIEIGIFSGTQPEWQYADFQTSLQKYGAYLNIKRGRSRETRLESTAALVAEYHSTTISREYVHFRNRISRSGRWSVYQSLDLDINRGWRKEKTGKSTAVSNLYLSGNLSPLSWLRVRLSYDNRKRYWYYEIQSLDEQLFDDRYRRGIKTDLIFNLPRNYYISFNTGYRNVEGEEDSRYSWSANLRKTRFTGLNFSYAMSYTSFSDVFSEGQRYSFKLSKYIKSSRLGLEYGRYSYDYAVFDSQRSSGWIRLEAFLSLSGKFYASFSGRRAEGDDINGETALTEFGYRF